MRRFTLTLCALAALSVPCRATETTVLWDGHSPGDWDTARDSARLAAEFSLSDISPVVGPDEGLCWTFVSKGVAFNDLFLRKPIERRFERLRLRARNAGAALTLAVKLGDAHGAEWTAGQVPVAEGAEWQWVEFPWDDWRVASWSTDPDGALDFPTVHLAVIAFDVRSGVKYQLDIARVEVEEPDRPKATLAQFRMPSDLDAGKEFPLTVQFSLDRPTTSDEAELVFRRDNSVVFRIPLELPVKLTQARPGDEVSVECSPRIPLYAWGGRLAVELRLGDAHIVREGELIEQEVATVTVNARQPGKTKAEVRTHNGVPTLFVNGVPHNGMAYAAYGPSVEVFRDFTAAGVHLYTFSATPTEAGYGLSRTSWTAEGEYDFSQLDERALMVLEADPDAFFFPRLYVHAPKWWSAEHPDDVVLEDRGDGVPVPLIHAGDKPAPSWASEPWRQATIAGLRRLIEHVESSPYADRVIGYHIASGTTEEWMMWGANENQWVDYSPANVARFRRWLRQRYSTDDALRAAWAQPDATLASAAVPTRVEREHCLMGSLRDPARERAEIDFYLYNSDLGADTICTLAKAVKDITRREKIVGVFYGYLLQLCGEQRQQNAGHLALDRVLASADVDFLCSPTSYAFRGLGGEGTSHFMSLLGSVHAHGKLWFDENDIRTSLSGGGVGEWGRPADVSGDIVQQNKELGDVLANGAAQWWFDVGGNRYNDPALMGRIGELVKCATTALDADRTPADEVALVVDENSLCYLRVGDPLGAWLLISQLPALHRIGAPVGHYLVSDLPRISDKRVFVLTTSFAPSDADRAAVDALKGGGRVLVFCYAPGLYSDGVVDEAAMERFTGTKLRLTTEPVRLQVTVSGNAGLAAGLEGAKYGVDSPVSPAVVPDDPAATVLGTLPDGRPGLVVKDFGDWTAVYSSAPMLPTRLLRNIAELAGVHTYIDTEDVVWASRGVVSITAAAGGARTVRLPRASTVTDLYAGTTVGRDLTRFEATFEPNETKVFVVGE